MSGFLSGTYPSLATDDSKRESDTDELKAAGEEFCATPVRNIARAPDGAAAATPLVSNRGSDLSPPRRRAGRLAYKSTLLTASLLDLVHWAFTRSEGDGTSP